MRRSSAVVLPTLGLLAALTGCAAEPGSVNRATTQTGDPSACPGEVVDVVVSVSQWADQVTTVAGDCATVTTVLASGSVDPHEFEPSTGDIAAFEDADLVVLNGLGYDSWAADAVDALDPRPAVVSVAAVAGLDEPGDAPAEDTGGDHEGHDHEGADPHLWYDPAIVDETVDAVAGALTELSPDAGATFTEGVRAWSDAAADHRAALEELRAAAEGRSYVATEPVLDRTARAVGLSDATPEGFRDAAAGGGEPAPADLAAIEAALGTADLLVVNPQTAGALPEQVRTTAEDAGVPVVEVTESSPDGAGSFLPWQTAQLRALTEALGGMP